VKRSLLIYGLVALASAILAVSSYRALFSKPDAVITSPLTEEMLVMRTAGGMLEVSRIRATEVFKGTFAHEFLAIDLDPTVTDIRVPAVYTYRIPLAKEWKVQRFGQDFAVVAPKVEPALPVAVDLRKIEKHVSGNWSFFTGTESLDAAERAITTKLALKARSPAYLLLQKEEARKTVAEFVRKWLVTQKQFEDVDPDRVHVFFADEAIGTMDPRVFPLNQQPEATSGARP
jgi:hypothetical protein